MMEKTRRAPLSGTTRSGGGGGGLNDTYTSLGGGGTLTRSPPGFVDGAQTGVTSSSNATASPANGEDEFRILVATRIRPFTRKEVREWRAEQRQGQLTKQQQQQAVLARGQQRQPFGPGNEALTGALDNRGGAGKSNAAAGANGNLGGTVVFGGGALAWDEEDTAHAEPEPVMDVENDSTTVVLFDPQTPGTARGIYTYDYVFSSFAPSVDIMDMLDDVTKGEDRDGLNGTWAEVGREVALATNANNTAGMPLALDDEVELSPDQDEEAEAEQRRIFSALALPLLDSAFEGLNVCIFAYGQTSSGKTYTMLGSKKHRGIMPRMCHELFRRVEAGETGPSSMAAHSPMASPRPMGGIAKGQGKQKKQEQQKQPGSSSPAGAPRSARSGDSGSSVKVRIEVSYMEIYNEQVRDLLKQRPKNAILHYNSRFDRKEVDHQEYQTLKVRHHPINGIYVEGLTTVAVHSWAECSELLRAGSQLRTQCSTEMNENSSRSHAIFQLVMTQTEDTGGKVRGKAVANTRVSKINMVDLAGSERNTSSQATGKHLVEANNINVSLSTLRRVIDGLVSRKKGQVIPYRESLLTYVLSDNFGGNSRTVMCANVSPSAANLAETESTLRYATMARAVRNRVKVNENPQARVIRELKDRLRILQTELANAPSKEELEALEYGIQQGEETLLEMQEREAELARDLQAREVEKNQLREALHATARNEEAWRQEAERAQREREQLRELLQRLASSKPELLDTSVGDELFAATAAAAAAAASSSGHSGERSSPVLGQARHVATREMSTREDDEDDASNVSPVKNAAARRTRSSGYAPPSRARRASNNNNNNGSVARPSVTDARRRSSVASTGGMMPSMPRSAYGAASGAGGAAQAKGKKKKKKKKVDVAGSNNSGGPSTSTAVTGTTSAERQPARDAYDDVEDDLEGPDEWIVRASDAFEPSAVDGASHSAAATKTLSPQPHPRRISASEPLSGRYAGAQHVSSRLSARTQNKTSAGTRLPPLASHNEPHNSEDGPGAIHPTSVEALLTPSARTAASPHEGADEAARSEAASRTAGWERQLAGLKANRIRKGTPLSLLGTPSSSAEPMATRVAGGAGGHGMPTPASAPSKVEQLLFSPLDSRPFSSASQPQPGEDLSGPRARASRVQHDSGGGTTSTTTTTTTYDAHVQLTRVPFNGVEDDNDLLWSADIGPGGARGGLGGARRGSAEADLVMAATVTENEVSMASGTATPPCFATTRVRMSGAAVADGPAEAGYAALVVGQSHHRASHSMASTITTSSPSFVSAEGARFSRGGSMPTGVSELLVVSATTNTYAPAETSSYQTESFLGGPSSSRQDVRRASVLPIHDGDPELSVTGTAAMPTTTTMTPAVRPTPSARVSLSGSALVPHPPSASAAVRQASSGDGVGSRRHHASAPRLSKSSLEPASSGVVQVYEDIVLSPSNGETATVETGEGESRQVSPQKVTRAGGRGGKGRGTAGGAQKRKSSAVSAYGGAGVTKKPKKKKPAAPATTTTTTTTDAAEASSVPVAHDV